MRGCVCHRTDDCCTIRKWAPGCHWMRGCVCHRTEKNALGENLLPLPRIEPGFLDCPAHSITTIPTEEQWLVTSNLQAFEHFSELLCPHHLETTVQRASEYKELPILIWRTRTSRHAAFETLLLCSSIKFITMDQAHVQWVNYRLSLKCRCSRHMPPLNSHQWLYMAAFMGQVRIKRTDANVSVTEFTTAQTCIF